MGAGRGQGDPGSVTNRRKLSRATGRCAAAAALRDREELNERPETAPHPPDPGVGQTRLGSRLPCASGTVPARAGRGVPTHPRLERRLGLSAASRWQEPEPRQAPGSGSGDPAGTARCRRGHGCRARTRCAAGGIRAGRALTWVPGRRAAGGGEGIPSGTPPASPAPGLRCSAERAHRVSAEGGGSWGGRGGWLSGVLPPPPAQSRASEPQPPAASPALRDLATWTSPRAQARSWHPWSRPAAASWAEAPGKRGCGRPSDHSSPAWAPRPAAPFGGCVPGPLCVLGPAPLPL